MRRGVVPDLVLFVLLRIAALRVPPALRGPPAEEGPPGGDPRVPGEGSPPRRHERPLVGRLDRDDEVGAVGHHHVGDLVQALARHLDPVDLQHLVVDGQEARGLGQPAGDQARDEDAGHLLQSLRGDPHGGAVADVEP